MVRSRHGRHRPGHGQHPPELGGRRGDPPEPIRVRGHIPLCCGHGRMTQQPRHPHHIRRCPIRPRREPMPQRVRSPPLRQRLRHQLPHPPRRQVPMVRAGEQPALLRAQPHRRGQPRTNRNRPFLRALPPHPQHRSQQIRAQIRRVDPGNLAAPQPGLSSQPEHQRHPLISHHQRRRQRLIRQRSRTHVPRPNHRHRIRQLRAPHMPPPGPQRRPHRPACLPLPIPRPQPLHQRGPGHLPRRRPQRPRQLRHMRPTQRHGLPRQPRSTQPISPFPHQASPRHRDRLHPWISHRRSVSTAVHCSAIALAIPA